MSSSLGSRIFHPLLLAFSLLWLADASPAQNYTLIELLDDTGDGAAAFDASLGAPLVVDALGNVYVASRKDDRIFRITPGGDVRLLLDASVSPIPFSAPTALALDASNNLYVAALSSNNVLRVASDGTVTEIISETSAPLSGPSDIAIDSAGVAYVSGFASDNAFRIEGSTITQIIDASGDGTTALDMPSHIAVDGNGNAYVDSVGTSAVFRIPPVGGPVQILDVNGDGATVFGLPAGLATDASNDVYVSSLHAVFRIRADGSGVQRLLDETDGVDGTRLGRPGSLAVDAMGNVFVAGEGESCNDGRDNGGDGLTDSEDDDCSGGAIEDGVSGALVFRRDTSGNLALIADERGDGGDLHPLNRIWEIALAPSTDLYASASGSQNLFMICADEDGDALCSSWERNGLDADGDGIVDLDLPNLGGPGVGADPSHKDVFLELDWSRGFEPRQSAIRAMKTAFAFAPIDAGGIPNPDGRIGINLWVDTGSLNVSQVSEDGAGPGTCSDGIDNGGGDGADQADLECAGIEDGVALGTCSDGLDNGVGQNRDGLIDSADPDCAGSIFEDGTFIGTCGDGLNNGLGGPREDEWSDLDDPDCLVGDDLTRECPDPSLCPPGSCRDGLDNDGFDDIDLADPDCFRGGNEFFNPAANERGGTADASCSDGVDNDGDDLIDAADPSCVYVDPQNVGLNSIFYSLKHGVEGAPAEDGAAPGTCFDGIDNANEAAGGIPNGNCSNGTDDDGDGLADSADPQCDGRDGLDSDCAAQCFDGLDNDADSRIDRGDANCAAGGNFDRRVRRLIFHYGTHARGSGGQGETPGNDFTEGNHDAATIMHELGHNLDLEHGGFEDSNLKPSYLSIMNYSYQIPGCLFQRNAPLCDSRMVDFSPARFGGSEGSGTGYDACYDGVDNDGDGAVDAEDGECVPLPGPAVRRAAAAPTLIETNVLENTLVLDGTDPSKFVLFWDAAGNQVMWPADGDLDVDGTPDLVELDGATPAGSGTTVPTVDFNRDGRCVCVVDGNTTGLSVNSNDLLRGAVASSGCVNSAGNQQTVESGNDRTCQTAAGPGDRQELPVGAAQIDPLVGYDDWSNLQFDFRTGGDFADASTSTVVVDDQGPLDREQILGGATRTDLALEKRAAPDLVEAGDPLTYSLTLANHGPNPAISARILDELPSQLSYQSDDGGCVLEAPQTLRCDVAALPAHEGHRVTVTVDTAGACRDGLPRPITNSASVTNLVGNDPNPGNDHDTVTVEVSDDTPPVVACNAPESIAPPDAPIAFTATATDICDAAPAVAITRFDCFKLTSKGRGIDKAESCVVTLQGDTLTIHDVGGVGTRIEWSVHARDASGNDVDHHCGFDVVRSGGP